MSYDSKACRVVISHAYCEFVVLQAHLYDNLDP